MTTTYDNSVAFSIGKAPRSKYGDFNDYWSLDFDIL